MIFYLAQRMDTHRFIPAADIVWEYARKLAQAAGNGSEIVVREVHLEPLHDPYGESTFLEY